MKKINYKEKGITLVALVITIIILLILTGVTLNTALSENGLFQRAKLAGEKYNIEGEREALEQSIVSYQISEITNEENNTVGIKLSNKNSINNNQWAVIQLLNDSKQVYGDGYIYIPKGISLEGNINTQHNWVINYNTGEIIDIGEEKKDYIKMSYDSGISVTDNLPLNISPLNMADENSWGKDVEFCNADNSGNDISGYNGTEIKFDGKDDYLKLENVEINESEGFTFEFYAKTQGDVIYPLEKTVTDQNDDRYDKIMATCFRSYLDTRGYFCCFSGLDSQSDKKVNDQGEKHWLKFDNVKVDSNYDYISVTVNYKTNTVTIFSKGKEIERTTCNHDYLIGTTLLDQTIPFTIGFYVGGDGPEHVYSKFDLYTCRLYTRVLSDEEIENNYNETTSYHNYLINN